jgi:hypothetical protein
MREEAAHARMCSAEIIPAYPLSPKVGRYDDIWASYVIYRIAGKFFRKACARR